MCCLSFVSAKGQTRYISCVSVLPPAKVCYSSSERLVDAVCLPDPVAAGLLDLLNRQYPLGCTITSGVVAADGTN